MPVVIKELIIRATVNDAPASAGTTTSNTSSQNSMADREALVQDCVEQVLEILQKKKER